MGEVVGSFGVRGWLKIRPYTEAPDTLLGYSSWWLKRATAGEWREFAMLEGRNHSGALLVALAGVDTREQALAMRGFDVGIPRDRLPAAAEGEIYRDDLVGLAVVNRQGVPLGEVVGVTEHGAHPLLRVARAERSTAPERLIPLVPAIVDTVDIGGSRIVVDWDESY